MANPTLPPLPDPPCGATMPDGQPCPHDSTVVVAAEWTTGYSMAVWRCHDHVGASVEATLRYSGDAVVTVTPLARFDEATEPAPEPPPTGERSLRLLR
jgi:hypothetical protein